jgi:putative transposase
MFLVESILMRSHWVMLVMDVFTRRIVGFSVERASIDGVAICRMFCGATVGEPKPKRLSTDHDPLFRFHRWLADLRVLEIEEIKSVPYTPVSHPFVERLIGTIRRGVSRPHVLLERYRSRAEAGRLPRLLQRPSCSSIPRR